MNMIQNYDFNGINFSVVVDENGNPLFNANDVCRILGYSNPRDAIAKHCKSDGVAKCDTIDNLGRTQQVNYLYEGNLYRLILKSNKPEAEPFERKVCDEILPSIRKTGGYIASHPDDTPELIMARALQVANETLERHKRQLQLAESRIYEKESQITVLKTEITKSVPKVRYYEEVLSSGGLITATEIAKNFGWSAKKLNVLLHQSGVQFYQSKHWILYAKYQDKGYAKLVPYPYPKNDGTTGTAYELKWTEPGKKFIHELLTEKGLNQKPLEEKGAAV